MGLDMFAGKVRNKPPRDVDLTAEEFEALGEFTPIASWRKHPNLHGWMKALYRKKGGTSQDFNCDPVFLSAEDIDELEKAVLADALPETSGFFFGRSVPEDKADDLAFIAAARAAIAEGFFVYYDSWW